MVKYSKIRKTASNIKKYVKKGAKAYLKLRRNPLTKQYLKGGSVSTTAIAKSLSNLSRKVASSSEYKLLEQNHTVGNPDVTLREYYRITAATTQSLLSTTSVQSTAGYYLQAITPPTRGDGLTNFDGKKYSMETIQWKGTLYNRQQDASVIMYIVQYTDEDGDPFSISEFLKTDNNGEYSINSKRNVDFKNYKVIASRKMNFSVGGNLRRDFNIIARPKRIVRVQEGDDTIHQTRYFLVMVASSDMSDRTTEIHYQGNTKIRFIN